MEDMSSSSSSCRHFSLDEIKEATNNFDEKKVLGHGGEGKVYLGKIYLGSENEKSRVAVKHLKENSNEFEKEIHTIPKIQHPHLVSLLGYCEESNQKILIYEYMENGSLSDNVIKRNSGSICLSWKQWLNICLGAARGLQHLHKETREFPKGIIHRDVKPANILLGENWVAKVSDFGMFKLSIAGQTKSSMITDLKGTRGYYAPEYVWSHPITRKIDVYAFGVVLFEVLCGTNPWERGGESYYGSKNEDFGLWAQENVDAKIKTEISSHSLKAFTDIIGGSMRWDPNLRPTMDGVIQALKTALEHQEEHENEQIRSIRLKATSDDIQTVSVTSRRTRASGSSVPPKKASLPFNRIKIFLPGQGKENESRASASEVDIEELIYIKTHFSTASASDGPGKGGRRSGSKGNKLKKVRLVDSKRAIFCENTLARINIPVANISSVVFTWDASALRIDQVENLIRVCPTKEEQELLKCYKGDKEMLGECEQFFMELMKAPRVESKLNLLYFKIQFSSQVNVLRHDLTTINDAAREVMESTKLRVIMQIISSVEASARGLRLDSLLKLSETHALNSKTTLMHFLCELLAEKMPDSLDFDEDLVHLEAASTIQWMPLTDKKNQVLTSLKNVELELTASETDGAISARFREVFKSFLDTAKAEVKSLISLYSEGGKSADSLAKYFGEDPARTPLEQVTHALALFVKMFDKARDENEQQADAKKKKLEMEALKEQGGQLTRKLREGRKSNIINALLMMIVKSFLVIFIFSIYYFFGHLF